VVVVFAQVAQAPDPGQKQTGPPSLPPTEKQLATITMDERFHVTR
jgi:hypothetical protein